MWRTFIPAAWRARTFSAQPETEHHIGGAPAHTLASGRWAMPSGMSPQTGRSMIEMLAVLAIIGILSVAALASLTWAMAKYRANDTMHDVAVWTFAALDSNQLFDRESGQLILPELGSVSTHGYPMAVWIQDKDVFTVHVNDVPKRVCSFMLDMIDKNQTLTVNDVRFNNDDICTNDTNTLVFYMNKDMGNVGSICIPSCEEGETCCGGECQVIMTPCGSDGCTDCGSDYCTTSNTCCPTPTATKCGDTDCCDTKCCNGVCCPESYMTCDATTTCGCPNNMVPDADTGACKCPDEAPYFFEEAGICCKSGYSPVEGVCQKVDCRGGPTSYNCYINDKLCGYNCDSFGRNCASGICYADECSKMNGETFGWYSLTSGYYGCFKTRSDGIECQSIYLDRHLWHCFTPQKDAICCSADSDLECINGTCDENACPPGFEADYFQDISACVKKDTLLSCTLHNGTLWRCYKNHLLCGNCADAQTCCDHQESCIDGYTFNAVNNRCENETGYCLSNMTSSQRLSADGYQVCYTKNDERCGVINGYSKNFTYGACSDPGCPDGMIYGQVNNLSYWGCIDETLGNSRMACALNPDYKPAICYYNGSLCGRRCDYDGTNCGEVYLPQCALAGHCPQTGYDMSGGCICDGDVTSADGTDYCCPTGHTYINGACAMT